VFAVGDTAFTPIKSWPATKRGGNGEGEGGGGFIDCP